MASSEDTYTLRINNTEVPSPGVPPVDTRRIWKIRANISANLGAGIYWIEVQGKAVNNQEFRFVPTTTIGSRGNGNAAQFTLTSNTVQALADTGYPNSSPDVTQDLAFNINYSDPLSTNEAVLASKVNLYPNPVEDILNIEYDSANPLRYDIIDITGKIVKKDEISKSINLSTLNSGVYMICLNLEGKKVYKKVIKK